MAAPASVRTAGTSTTGSKPGQWPLAFCLQPPKAQQPSLQGYGFNSNHPPSRQWWSHELYRGPCGEKVEILYSKSKERSEEIAKQFLGQPILGFDMEWPMPWLDKRQTLQSKIGLIQIACEDKVALFHIGMHQGKTTADIIAPTLKQIIEDPTVGKVGVHILGADFSRLQQFFGLKPQGAVESSNLHRLVKYGSSKPEFVTTKMVKLATQVEEELGLPLFKGEVRTSNWSKPLSDEQIKYAAADAYAGFMLYHRMNAKRLTMNPVPPLPIHAERYPKGKTGKNDPILLDAGSGVLISSEDFFNVKITPSRPQQVQAKVVKAANPPTPKVPAQPLDHVSQRLYDVLVIRRSLLARQNNILTFRIISDAILQRIARAKPLDTEALLLVKGVGKFQVEKYGDAWLEVIALFFATNGMDASNSIPTNESSATKIQKSKVSCVKPPRTPKRANSRGRTPHASSTDSSPAFATPPPHVPQLHTGLSFNMGETSLNDEVQTEVIPLLDDSDDSLASLDFGSSLKREDSKLKRKRAESPARRGETASGADNKASDHTNNGAEQHPNAPLTPRSKISRNKLLAFSRQVAAKLPARPADGPPLVSEHTLELVVATKPTSQGELEKIPGIDTFLLACKQTNIDLLEKIKRFAPVTN
ncbi:hypothetical protein IQ07DRAFT_586658 [Pyrenochaeta sp. DS3sAY3a]|nr:hypothetical protein IQ07DRAFT_586658 [Pyrenochaeta sp. DS3sAY3a]